MKLHLFIAIWLSVFLCSCNNEFKNSDKTNLFIPINSKLKLNDISSECKTYLNKELQSIWKYNPKGNCYLESEGVRLSLIKNEECFKALNGNQLTSFLGQPNKIFEDKKSDAKILTYHLGESCGKYYPYWTMHFIYNEKDSLLRIGMNQISNE